MTDSLNKEEFAERITEAVLKTYDPEMLRRMVWDQTYDELIHLEWVDLLMYAEEFGLPQD
jgi:hypothetical protein